YFFEAIASKLKEEGHEIFWIIQNKLFAPKGDFKKFIIPYLIDKISTGAYIPLPIQSGTNDLTTQWHKTFTCTRDA
ncbi:MAG: hypothetical protein ACPG7F_06915, partial [Aggregatilineales bacterium]